MSNQDSLVRVEDLVMHFPIRRGVFQRTVGYVHAVVEMRAPAAARLELVARAAELLRDVASRGPDKGPGMAGTQGAFR